MPKEDKIDFNKIGLDLNELEEFLDKTDLEIEEIVEVSTGTNAKLEGPISNIRDEYGTIYNIGLDRDWKQAKAALRHGIKLYTMPGKQIKSLGEGPQKRLITLVRYEKNNTISKKSVQEVSKVDMKKLMHSSLKKNGFIHIDKHIFERFGVQYRVHLMYSTNDNGRVLKDILDNPDSNMLIIYPNPNWINDIKGNYAITGFEKWKGPSLIKKGAVAITELGAPEHKVQINVMTRNGALQTLYGTVFNGNKYYKQIQVNECVRASEPKSFKVTERKLGLNGIYAGPYNFNYITLG